MTLVSELLRTDNEILVIELEEPPLDRYSQVEVVLSKNNQRYILAADSVDYVFRSLKDGLSKRLPLPDGIVLGEFGKAWNEDAFNVPEDGIAGYDASRDIFNQYDVWDTQGSLTFLYESKGELYLEVALNYPWLFKKPKRGDKKFQTFEAFVKNYKPLMLVHLTQPLISQWATICNEILERIGC